MSRSMITFSLSMALWAFTASAAPKPQFIPGQIPGIERHDLCPRGWQYRVEGACSSGFIGCADPEDSLTCGGGPDRLRFDGNCARTEYGQYYTCDKNGFYGCSPNPDVCSQPGPEPPAQPIPGLERYDLCPPGWQWVAPGACPSGFVGCSNPNDAEVCAGMPVYATCNRPEYGTYKTCANGFFGCSPLDWDPCQDGETSAPDSPSETPNNNTPTDNTPTDPKCAAGTTYFGRNTCSSGFVGCGSAAQCAGPRRFWSDCPARTGVYNVCANGFVGCTTVSNPCQ
jgi:hypothetical protein